MVKKTFKSNTALVKSLQIKSPT